MPEFLNLTPPEDARGIFFSHYAPHARMESVCLEQALGRVSAAPVAAIGALPAFPRSTVDGYAVIAADTFGAGDSLPMYLKISGEVMMGAAPDFALLPGYAALIHTGGMLPERADAVVMLEQTQRLSNGMVEIQRAVAVGENVIKVGEDVQPGAEVIPAGKRLRPEEIGGLAALGIQDVRVVKRPRVGLLSSGDEVQPLGSALGPGQVYDVNTHSLGALVAQAGGETVAYGILPDDLTAMETTARRALSECDLVVLTAGSSASARDYTAQVINRLGEPGVLVHGLNFRPGKPTILAVCDGKAVVGLPGNPVSALVVARLFLVPIIERFLGLQVKQESARLQARLTVNIPSQAGREDWVAVRLVQMEGEVLAEPLFGKSNLIFTLVRADGMVCIPMDATGLAAGERVEVFLS